MSPSELDPAGGERRLREAVLSATWDSYVVFDRELRLLEWNEVAAQMAAALGTRPLEQGAHLLDLVVPGTEAGFAENARRALAGERVSVRREVQGRGRPFFIEAIYAPVHDAAGAVESVVFALRDVTLDELERRRTLEEVELARVSEALLRQLPEAVVAIDAELRIGRWRGAATPLFGWAGDEVRGQPVARLFAPAERAQLEAALAHAVAARERIDRRASAVCKSSRLVPVSVFGAPMEEPPSQGDAPHCVYLLVLRDERERAALEEQLRLAQKLEALGLLAGTVAHDLNNVLAGVLAHAQLARDELPAGHAARLELDGLEQIVERASALTRQLVTFASPRRRDDVVDPLAAIEDALALVRRLLGPSIQVDVALEATGSAVPLDASQLEQVLVNLAINARDALEGGGWVGISLARASEPPPEGAPGEHVVLTVEDDGPGIPPSLRTRVFEPFFSTKAPGRGTGLGLSTSRALVEGAGGVLVVDEGTRGGARFRAFLPCVDLPESPPSRTPQRVEAGAGRRLLLVEDEPAIRRAYQRTLRQAGYVVTTAADGREAVERLLVDPPFDALVTDLALPHVGGVEVARAFHARYPAAPILVVTGYPTQELEALRHDALPAMRVMEKPVAVPDLLRALEQLLGG